MIHHYYQILKKKLEGIPTDVEYDFGQIRQSGETSIKNTPIVFIKFNPINWSDQPQSIQESKDINIDISIVTTDRFGDERSINNEVTNHQVLCDAVFARLHNTSHKLSDYILNLPSGEDMWVLESLTRVTSTHPYTLNNLLITTYRFQAYGHDCTSYIDKIQTDWDIVLEYAIGNSPVATSVIQTIRNLSFVLSSNGITSQVAFNPSLPLSNVLFPQNVGNGHSVRARFSDGYANYSYVGGTWIFHWFEPLGAGGGGSFDDVYHTFLSSNNLFTPGTPLQNVVFPSGIFEGHTVSCKFNDGFAAYTYNGTEWVFNWFFSLSANEVYHTLVTSNNLFTPGTPLLNVVFPSGVFAGHTVRCKFNDGYANYTYNGTVWSLNYFEVFDAEKYHTYLVANGGPTPSWLPFPPANVGVITFPTGVNEGHTVRVRFANGYATYTYAAGNWNHQWFEQAASSSTDIYYDIGSAFDGSFNIILFNPGSPLDGVTFPTGVATGHTYRARYLDGYANYFYNGFNWQLTYFEPKSSSILNGAGVPSGSLGFDGDYYINTTNWNIYGPKTAGAWGSATSLIGPQGRTVLNGSGVPGGGTGVDGDFYINTSTWLIYGPKTAGAWGSGTSLIGPSGRTVLNGSGVPGGGTGADGDFYIDTTAWDIYGPKTAGAWGSGTSLIGPPGSGGGGGGTPGGSNNQVQYNSSGAFAGAANVEIDNGNLLLKHNTGSAASTDGIIVHADNSDGKRDLMAINEFEAIKLMPSITSKRIAWLTPTNNNSFGGLGHNFGTALGTVTAPTYTNTNVHQSSHRVEILRTSPSSTQAAGYVPGGLNYQMDKGIIADAVWGPATGVTNGSHRMFFGFTASTSSTDVNPSTYVNCFGFGYDAADGNMQFMHNDASGSCTKIDLGSLFPKPSADRTNYFKMEIIIQKGDTTLYYKITDLGTLDTVSGSVNTDLPSGTTFIAPRMMVSVGGVSSVIGIAWSQVYVESLH